MQKGWRHWYYQSGQDQGAESGYRKSQKHSHVKDHRANQQQSENPGEWQQFHQVGLAASHIQLWSTALGLIEKGGTTVSIHIPVEGRHNWMEIALSIILLLKHGACFPFFLKKKKKEEGTLTTTDTEWHKWSTGNDEDWIIQGRREIMSLFIWW